MNPELIDLRLPPKALVKGALYNTYDLDYLSEDLLEITLESGLTIDVGWYPEGERPGAFQVVLFNEFWRQQVIPPLEVQTLPELTQLVEDLAAQYSKNVISYSDSTKETVNVQSVQTPFEIELVAA
jgi:hypothetical protein